MLHSDSMQFRFQTVRVNKRYPLAISRGVQAYSDNLFVFAEKDDLTGIGELAPATASAWDAETGQQQLETFLAQIGEEDSIYTIYRRMRDEEIIPPAMAALDVALWDLRAKEAGMSLYRLLGLPNKSVPTSLTIGLNPIEVIRERVPEILARTGAKFLKIKLGSPQGIKHDQESFLASKECATPFGAGLRVDANGGWNLPDAQKMLTWLASHGVDYVEQPLNAESDHELPQLFENRPLPIYVDESVRFSEDIPRLAHCVDGINLKLMKCGGITEALRIVATARAHGLKTMIGCMSETSVAISAGAAIGALFDHIDLDSHLNLAPDPATGALFENGTVTPTDAPGHGGALLA